MSSCCSGFCASVSRRFDARVAESDLRRYHGKGPNPTTRELRDLVGRVGGGQTVLDVGAGVGALSFELLARGFLRATAVDASPAYVVASRGEAVRRGESERFEALEGDFVTLGDTIASADVVVLDRVVCCYPAFEPLLDAALAHSEHLLGMSYPHDRWYVRVVVWALNALRRLRRSPFQAYVHPPEAMRSVAARHGFHCVAENSSPVWAVVIFSRDGA